MCWPNSGAIDAGSGEVAEKSAGLATMSTTFGTMRGHECAAGACRRILDHFGDSLHGRPPHSGGVERVGPVGHGLGRKHRVQDGGALLGVLAELPRTACECGCGFVERPLSPREF